MKTAVRIIDPEAVAVEATNGVRQADLGFSACRARLIRYDAGTHVPMHCHSDETLKVILRGSMAFEDDDGPIGVVPALGMYFCGAGWYRADVIEDTMMLLLERPGTERVPYPS